MLTNLWQSIIQLSLVALVIIIVAYMIYAISLSVVFRRLGAKPRYAFIPGYNYIVLIRTLGLPKSWQATAFVPYIGQIYSVAVGVRLGKIFGKNKAFSSIWLTIGAPIGMPMIALSKITPDLSAIDEPAPKIDQKKLRKLSLHPKKAKNKA